MFRKLTYSAPDAWPPASISANLAADGPGHGVSAFRAPRGQPVRAGRRARRPRRPADRGEPAGREHLDGPQRRRGRNRGLAGRPRRLALVRGRRFDGHARPRAVGHALRRRHQRSSLLLDAGDRGIRTGPRRDRDERRRRRRTDQRRGRRAILRGSPRNAPAAADLHVLDRVLQPAGRSRAAAALGRLLVHERRPRRRHDDVDDSGVLQRGRFLGRSGRADPRAAARGSGVGLAAVGARRGSRRSSSTSRATRPTAGASSTPVPGSRTGSRRQSRAASPSMA